MNQCEANEPADCRMRIVVIILLYLVIILCQFAGAAPQKTCSKDDLQGRLCTGLCSGIPVTNLKCLAFMY